MSYILDALKKSQQEREAVATDSVAVTSVPVVSSSTSKSTQVLIALALVVLLLVLVVLLVSQRSAPVDDGQAIMTRTEVQTNKQAETALTTEVVNPPTIAAAREPKSTHEVEFEDKESKPEIQLENQPEKAQIQERRLPPLESLRKIPALIINSHIYSSIASKRRVTINNKSQREGDYLTADVVISEITAQGLVIEVDGWPLNISRQQGWQPIPEGS